MKRTDKDGKPLIPGDNDWQGTLSTGATMIRVRERRPEDEPATFSAQLEFRQPDGQRIEQGEFEVFVQSKGRSLLKGELQLGMLVVPINLMRVLLLFASRSPARVARPSRRAAGSQSDKKLCQTRTIVLGPAYARVLHRKSL